MWSPIDIFAVCFLLNFSPDKDARLNVKETIINNQNKEIAQSVSLRKD
jgi:hypothetical protein